jgi:hypothetical protein
MAIAVGGSRQLPLRSVLREAAAAGFSLVHYETAAGQVVWEWQRGDEPRPQFVTERVALHWMTEWLRADRER